MTSLSGAAVTGDLSLGRTNINSVGTVDRGVGVVDSIEVAQNTSSIDLDVRNAQRVA